MDKEIIRTDNEVAQNGANTTKDNVQYYSSTYLSRETMKWWKWYPGLSFRVVKSLSYLGHRLFARARFSQIIVNNLFGDKPQETKKHFQIYLQVGNVNTKLTVCNFKEYFSKVLSPLTITYIFSNQIIEI